MIEGLAKRREKEPKLRATRRERVDDSGNVVANETETRDFAIILHGSPQGVLGIGYKEISEEEEDEGAGSAPVMRSASSRMIILYGGIGYSPFPASFETASWAKSLTFVRT